MGRRIPKGAASLWRRGLYFSVNLKVGPLRPVHGKYCQSVPTQSDFRNPGEIISSPSPIQACFTVLSSLYLENLRGAGDRMATDLERNSWYQKLHQESQI